MVSEVLSGPGAPIPGNPGRLRSQRWRILFEASREHISGAIFSNAEETSWRRVPITSPGPHDPDRVNVA